MIKIRIPKLSMVLKVIIAAIILISLAALIYRFPEILDATEQSDCESQAKEVAERVINNFPPPNKTTMVSHNIQSELFRPYSNAPGSAYVCDYEVKLTFASQLEPNDIKSHYTQAYLSAKDNGITLPAIEFLDESDSPLTPYTLIGKAPWVLE
jgi:hypothetical protein